MWHWGNATYQSLSTERNMQILYGKTAVVVALRCDFVVLALLSLAASHLAYLDPVRRVELVERGLRYQNMATKKAAGIVLVPDGPKYYETVENLFVFSVLTMFHGALGQL